MSKEQQDLASFQWEDTTDSFFGVNSQGEPIEEQTENITKETIEDTPEETPKKVTDKKPIKKVEDNPKDEEEDDFFFEVDTSESKEEDFDENEDSPKDLKSTGEASIYTDMFLDLKDKKLFKHVDLEEGEDLDHERFSEIMEEEVEAEISSRLQHWAEQELDEDAQAFIKFKKDGGSTEDFFKMYKDNPGVPVGDINDSKYQDKIIRMQLESEGWDDEEIEDRLEYLESNGRKAKIAEKALAKIKEEEESEREALVERQRANTEAQRKSQQEYINGLQKTVSESSEINGFKITPKDKKELVSFLTKPTHELNGKKLTGMQHKLGEVFKDPEKTILLAKLLSSDFDMKDIVKKASSEKTKDFKSRMEQRSTKSRGGGSSRGKSVADFF